MKTIKYLLLIFIFLLNSNISFAIDKLTLEIDEDYLIVSDKTVKKTNIADESIFVVKPFFTILNEKKMLLLTPKKIGKSLIVFLTENERFEFEVTVKENRNQSIEYQVKKIKDFEFVKLDKPPVSFEIDEPPVGGVK